MMKPLLAAGAALLALAPAHAGTLILAGDATIAFRINTGVTTGAASLAGNVTFAKTILGAGKTVAVLGDSENYNGPGQLTAAYNSFAGVTATSFYGAVTDARLENVDLLFAFFPSRAFSMAETEALTAFLDRGGTLFLAGESAHDPFGNPLGLASNTRINDLLAGLGSTMRLDQVSLDISDQFAVGNEVVAHPLTAGVASFGYGLTTTVNGGAALFLTNDLKPFVAVETIGTAAVPEPATWAMLIAGFGLVGGAVRARRRRLESFAA
ncbi:PEPxxWA-CTERM sorting domain-containing protein [Sphingomonas flavalba]|uniref:PEPxxWA-CTERM sorting domain-containing protein n=1 Tax=Sphingomonas flavalba TaxID=2559804 RepID=UPI001EF0EBFF|nr:PEPxxWA-CTERM sorting domain-containing protein [Sphingomonas flavalba]